MSEIFENKKFRKDNKGSALIVCIIVLLFVSILATVILYMSGVNYRMKKTDTYAKYAFYAAEEPLERMQTNLIIPISASLNSSYRTCNSIYGFRANSNDRRREFYTQFALEFRDLMIKQYGGSSTSIGVSGETIGDGELIKNIVHNLVICNNLQNDYNTALWNPREVYFIPSDIPVDDIYVNDPSIGASSDPMGFINTLAGLPDRGDGHAYFEGNADGSPRAYICLSTPVSGSSAIENYNNFIRLSVTENSLTDDPVFPTNNLLPENECRLLIQNISIVVVQNGYRSIISTDIAIQFPPLDWSDGAITPLYEKFDPYQLIYYVNWQKN
jgi:hypothetical protein